ncbi:GTP-binding protein [Termitidicoccus mucosus]|uniref:GTP-binding protein n=1 Tax=Termitidicoccus mucosus TaxID=1184151 RepID=UPI003CCB8B03
MDLEVFFTRVGNPVRRRVCGNFSSKAGPVWCAPRDFSGVWRPNRIGFLSVAGRETRIDYLGPWAAALVERGSVPFSAIPDSLREFWQEPSGDRRQEIVLIGVNLDADALGRALNEQVISFTHS